MQLDQHVKVRKDKDAQCKYMKALMVQHNYFHMMEGTQAPQRAKRIVTILKLIAILILTIYTQVHC